MDAEELISAIFAKIDEYQQRMEAIFDKSLQKIATNSFSSPTQISSSKSEEKGVLALEDVPRPGDGKVRASNQQLRECHLQIGGQEVLVESVQENAGNTMKMAKMVMAQESELESLADSEELVHGVLEASPSVLGTGPADKAREFARAGPIPSSIPTVSVIPNLQSPNLTHGTLEFIDFLREPLKVNSDPLEVEVSDVATDKMGAFDVSVESIEVCLSDFRVDSLDLLANQSAQQVFVAMPIRGSNLSVPSLGQSNRVFDPGDTDSECYRVEYVQIGMEKFGYGTSLLDIVGNLQILYSFDMVDIKSDIGVTWTVCAVVFKYMRANEEPCLMPFDRGRSQALHSCPLWKDFSWEMQDYVLIFDSGMLKLAGCDAMEEVSLKSISYFKAGIDTSIIVECATWKPAIDFLESLPFDPGGVLPLFVLQWVLDSGVYNVTTTSSYVFDPGSILGDRKISAESLFAMGLVETHRKLIFVYDPGGIDCSRGQS